MYESMVFYRSFYEAFKMLPTAEDKAEALDAIFKYGLDEIDEVPENPMAAMVYIMARPQVRANNERKEAGAKGGRPKKENHRLPEEKTIGFEKENHRLLDEKPNVNVKGNANANAKVNVNANANDNYYNIYEEYFGVNPTNKEKESIELLLSLYDTELVEYAFQQASEQNRKTIAYVKGVLSKLALNNINNMEDLAEYHLQGKKI